MPKSTYLANNILNLALRGIPFTPPTSVNVALYTVAPGVGGGGTEVVGGGYGRQVSTFTVPASGQVISTADILFPVALATWGTIVAFALLDASSGGNMLYFGNLSTPRLVLASDQVRFPAGQLVCQET
jgi:hypothetical protein